MGIISISYEDAVKALKYINTFDELASLIAKLDAKGAGTKTLLYSGSFSADIGTWELANGMAEHDSSYRIVDSTERARFLNVERNPALGNLLEKLSPEGHWKDSGRNGGSPPQSLSNKFLFDVNFTDPTTGKSMLGAWAQLSHDFVMLADGNIRILSPFADPNRVFAEVELKAAMDNPRITHIEGYPKSFFERLGFDAEVAGKNAHAMRVTALIS